MRKYTCNFLNVLFVIFLTACGVNDNNISEQKDNLIKVKNTAENHVDAKSGQEIAKHLTEIATGIPSVNDATAVVVGEFAVVGIDVNAKLDRSRVESIKYSVAESLQHDPYGANAVVIADADTFQRLQQMGKEIQEGRPIGGILDELAQIVGRVMPDVPSDILENQNVQPTEQNKNQLNGKEKQQLDKEQQDQSNNKMNN